jgi:hypothetical protein
VDFIVNKHHDNICRVNNSVKSGDEGKEVVVEKKTKEENRDGDPLFGLS